jgi:hypothetical protein
VPKGVKNSASDNPTAPIRPASREIPISRSPPRRTDVVAVQADLLGERLTRAGRLALSVIGCEIDDANKSGSVTHKAIASRFTTSSLGVCVPRFRSLR